MGKKKISVNSYHYETVTGTFLFEAVGFSDDGILEVIENKNHPFQIGVQWHPERMLEESKEMKKLIKTFADIIKDA